MVKTPTLTVETRLEETFSMVLSVTFLCILVCVASVFIRLLNLQPVGIMIQNDLHEDFEIQHVPSPANAKECN